MRKRILLVGAALGTLLVGQDAGDKVTVPFRDPSKPRTLTVNVMNGGMTVQGYDGKDAVIESKGRGERSSRRRPGNIPDTMHQIGAGAGGLDIVEDNNVIKVTGGMSHSVDLTIQVPRDITLNLRTLNGGKIVVENVTGEIVVDNMNGSIEINNASGAVVANSQNGKITASLNKLTPNKSMSFVTMNGAVDVTLPADTKANLKMKTDNGEIWSDFDMKLDSTSRPPQVDDRRKDGGHYRVRLEKGVYASINGGGPEITLQTFNGSILIRKK